MPAGELVGGVCDAAVAGDGGEREEAADGLRKRRRVDLPCEVAKQRGPNALVPGGLALDPDFVEAVAAGDRDHVAALGARLDPGYRAMMRALKRSVDPANILNPGVSIFGLDA